MKSIIQFAQNSLLEAGAEKVQCSLEKSEKHELNVSSGEVSLLRTTFDTKLTMTGILNNQKGQVTINKVDEISILDAVSQVIEFAESTQPDPANDIAEKQTPKNFHSGPVSPNLDKMYFRLNEFKDYVKEHYPTTILRETRLNFTKSKALFSNSNGVDFCSNHGAYSFVAMFSSKKDLKTSSFNYTAAITNDLDRPFIERSSFRRLLGQSSEQTETRSIPENFVGNIIVTPECMDDIIGGITKYLHDHSLITGTSVYKDKLDKAIAVPSLTLHSAPLSDELAIKYFVTSDGFEVQNSTLIDHGVLRSFLLGLYASNKTGLPKAVNEGGCLIIEPGDTSFEEMIKSTDKGILLCRISGGQPSDNGDFSGVAKNSYYIENGQIQYPISETMVNGNLVEMLNNINQISKERVNSGYSLYPWIKFDGLTVSGERKGEDGPQSERSEERRVGKECRSRWSPYH